MPGNSVMSAPPPPNTVNQTSERFVAFAFAGAEMMAETEPCGTITYATGAFRTRFGAAPESFVGLPIANLVAPSDHEALDMALTLLSQRGRLSPIMLRMADQGRSALAMAGIVLPEPGRPTRLCVTFAQPPEPAAAVLRPDTSRNFARTTERRLRAGSCRDIYLMEIAGAGDAPAPGAGSVRRALELAAPHAQAGELAPGRYGLLGDGDAGEAALGSPDALEKAFRQQGMDVSVGSLRVSLDAQGLTPPQMTRALRQALATFARGGLRGLADAGLGSDLSGYMRQAGRKSDILRRVLRDGRFSLSYQPIVSLADRATHHYEALIRPRPIPNLEVAGPQDFVMLIEALGLADELDLRVAGMACDRAAAARRCVAFNVSGQSIQNPAFRDRLIATLTRHPASRGGLVILEMTETAEIEDIAEALATADALRRIGVPFCLDDFGAGAADMRLLRQLNPNIVKLDGSYVPGVAAAGRERSFIAGMVEVARAVGAAVVAERIETEAEAASLTALGVEYGQGWLFGRPEDLPDARARILKRAGAKDSWQ